MSAINLISGNSFGETLPDLETVRLIYTHQKEHPKTTIAIHLTIDDLQDILKEIHSMKGPDKTGNGVTLYIGKYPHNYPPIEKQNYADYSNRLTVVAVPTYEGVTKETYFDFMDAKTVKECKQKIDNGAPVNPGVAGADHYKLCPPDTGCASANIIWNNL